MPHTKCSVTYMSHVIYMHIYKHIHVYNTCLCAYTHTHTHMYMFSEHLLCADTMNDLGIVIMNKICIAFAVVFSG